MFIMIKKIIALVGLTILLCANTGLAGNVTYNWGGLIERPGPWYPDAGDPFNFGGDGWASSVSKDYSKGGRFELDITIDSLTTDSNTIDNPGCVGQCYEAEYAVSKSTLTINGSARFLDEGPSTLTFKDNVPAQVGYDGYDFMYFQGVFSLPEGVLFFRSSFTLDDESYTLSPLSVDPLPLTTPGIYSTVQVEQVESLMPTFAGFGRRSRSLRHCGPSPPHIRATSERTHRRQSVTLCVKTVCEFGVS
jgi:hypothetical protein